MPSNRPSHRPRGLIFTVLGAYIHNRGGWIAVSSLVDLMEPLGVSEPSVRSAVFRLVKAGLLSSQARDGRSGYLLTSSAEQVLEEGDRRIFSSAPPSSIENGWIVVTFSVPESERPRRHALRSRLAWLGFGNLGNAVWISPARALADLEAVIEANGLEEYVYIFHAHYRGFNDLESVVRRSWDLDELAMMYRDFLTQTRPVMRRWAIPKSQSPGAAFVDYTLALHSWRKFPYIDPGLPAELLPTNWEGQAAAIRFDELRKLLEPRATRYVDEVAGY